MPKIYEIYANLVENDRKTRDDVPETIREKVGQILLERKFIDKYEFETDWSITE